MIRHNLKYKLLALSIAIVLWFYVNKGYNPIVTKEIPRVPLVPRKVEPGMIVTRMPKTVRVVLEGSREHVNATAADVDEMLVHINLRGKGPGTHKVPVVVVPPTSYAGLVKATPEPREVMVTIVREAQRTMQADVEFAGTPPVGFRFGAPEFTPPRAVISGLPDRVSRVNRLTVTVEPAQLREGVIEGDFTLSAKDKDGKEVQGLRINPAKVHLRLRLEQVPATRVVFVSPNIVGQPPFPYRVSEINVKPQVVTITGRPERLMQISAVSTQPLNLTSHTQTFTQRVAVSLPPGTSVADARYVRVTVRIESPAESATPQTESPKQ